MTSAGPEPEDIKSVVRELVLHVMMLEMMVLKLVLVMVEVIVCGWSRSGAVAVVERGSSATKSKSVWCMTCVLCMYLYTLFCLGRRRC